MSAVAPPTIDREPYERVDAWTETAFEAPFVRVDAHSAVYEDPGFLERVRAAIPPALDQSPRSLFTTGLEFSRSPPGDRTTEGLLGIAARYARREFRRDLAGKGLRDVAAVGSRDLRLPDGRAKAFSFDAAYPLSGVDESLPVRVWAAIWPTPGAYEMAGGVFPVSGSSLPDGEVIEARPRQDREEVIAAIRAAAD